MKINIFNETKRKIPKGVISKIGKVIENSSLKKLKNLSINLIFQTSRAISKLNKELFNRSGPTDVISVNQPTAHGSQLPPEADQPLAGIAHSPRLTAHKGDIYICPEVIRSNAKKYNVSYNEELARVIIHGILHLAGYDHKKPYGESKEKMFVVQERLVNEIKTHL